MSESATFQAFLLSNFPGTLTYISGTCWFPVGACSKDSAALLAAAGRSRPCAARRGRDQAVLKGACAGQPGTGLPERTRPRVLLGVLLRVLLRPPPLAPPPLAAASRSPTSAMLALRCSHRLLGLLPGPRWAPLRLPAARACSGGRDSSPSSTGNPLVYLDVDADGQRLGRVVLEVRALGPTGPTRESHWEPLCLARRVTLASRFPGCGPPPLPAL